MSWILLPLVAGSIWVIILLLPWRPWSTKEVLEAQGELSGGDLTDVTVLIPARNEAEGITTVLAGLNEQGSGLSVLLIDDQSTDDTAVLAQKAAAGGNLRILQGAPPPPGWSGKLWGLEQGFREIGTELTLLMDADIYLEKGVVASLRQTMRERGADFLSLMAALRMSSFWERLLMPSFIYFFKLLYPFGLSNSSRFPTIAAAAGGCIMLRTRVLRELGGFGLLRGALIDDCTLARLVKSRGFKTWIGLTHSVRSLRPYPGLSDIWNMVSRTAFTQLHYSALLLFLCTALMLLVFLVPVAGLSFPDPMARWASVAALGAMMISYLPTLSFYRLPYRWALALPLIGLLFLAMTWTSALRHWSGKGARWKGRSYTSRA